jgi:hypothetical protein
MELLKPYDAGAGSFAAAVSEAAGKLRLIILLNASKMTAVDQRHGVPFGAK